MKTFSIVMVTIALSALLPASTGTAGCAGCGSNVEPCWDCQRYKTSLAVETPEWGVVSEQICVTRCRLLSRLQFWKKAGCSDCDANACDAACCGKNGYTCTIRPRNRLMRKSIVEYVPTLDYVVVPVCVDCDLSSEYGEPLPLPHGFQDLAAVVRKQRQFDAIPPADVTPIRNSRADRGVRPTIDDNPTPARVHWIGSDPSEERGQLPGTTKFRLSNFASPLGKVRSSGSSRGQQTNDQLPR